MLKLTGEVRRCWYNSRLMCRLKTHNPKAECPLNDYGFLRFVERWLLLHRTPKSVVFSPSNAHFSLGSRFFQDEKVADKAMIFDNPDRIIDYFLTGRLTYQVCRDLRRARWKFRKRGRV